MQKKWALFFSGKGSNLRALVQMYASHWSKPPLLVTNNAKAGGLAVAQDYNLEVLVLEAPIDYLSLHQKLIAAGVERIFLLGYLKVIPGDFLKHWEKRIFNLHPSLLPLYPGLKSIARAYQENADIGVSIHHVSDLVDQGKVLMQEVAFFAGSYKDLSLEEVTSIVHSKEHQMICEFIPQGEGEFGKDL